MRFLLLSIEIFGFLFTTVFVHVSLDAKDACREAVFEKVGQGEPLKESILSNHHVQSKLDCSQLCLQKQHVCVAFSYSSRKTNDEINCILSRQLLKSKDNNEHEDDPWITYEIRDLGPEICPSRNICQHGGRCLVNSCKPEGYSCECDQKYYGKHCEHENNDFDLSFHSQDPVQSYVRMKAIKGDLRQLTFSTWFKISVGVSEYHLLSYMANDTGGYIDLAFMTEGYISVERFQGKISQCDQRTYITPVNDGFWHHLGFTWTTAGHWNVFIDGTHRALRSGVKVGAVIPGGGTLVIGQKITSAGSVKAGKGFLGEISRLNLWDTALSGYEIERMSKVPGNETGNIIRWFNVAENIFGRVKIVSPSQARSTGEGLDFELSFEFPPLEKGYILAPGKNESTAELTACLWLKVSSKSTFVSYNLQNEVSHTFAFGVDANSYMFAYINENLVTSTKPNANIVNNLWHFLCLTWNGRSGKVHFYYDATDQGKTVIKTVLITVIPGGGNYSVGVTKDNITGSYVSSDGFVGKMSYLNVWGSNMPLASITAMASGGVNINGDLLSWRDVPKSIVGNLNIKTKTEIHYPGYGLLAKRSKWCHDEETSSPCSTIYARLGGEYNGTKMAWRCYCAEALMSSKYTYDYAKKSKAYSTNHKALTAIVD